MKFFEALILFIVGIIFVVIVAGGGNSYGADYDYPGQIYQAITDGREYDTAGYYDVDGDGSDEAQWVPVVSKFLAYDPEARSGWLVNTYLNVETLGGFLLDMPGTPLQFTVTSDGLIKIGGGTNIRWFVYAITHDLIRASNFDESGFESPQILVWRRDD